MLDFEILTFQETHFESWYHISQRWSKRCEDIAIIVIFNMTAAAIWYFGKFEILTVWPLWGANMRHRAKFHQNRSNGCRDMAISRVFLKMTDLLGAYWDHPWRLLYAYNIITSSQFSLLAALALYLWSHSLPIHIIFFTNNRSFLPVCFPSFLESTFGYPPSTPH